MEREASNEGDAKMANDILDEISDFLVDFHYQSPYRVHIDFQILNLIVVKAVGYQHTPRETGSLIDRLIGSRLISNMQRNPCNKQGKGFLYCSPDGYKSNVCYDLSTRINDREIKEDNAKQRRQANARRG